MIKGVRIGIVPGCVPPGKRDLTTFQKLSNLKTWNIYTRNQTVSRNALAYVYISESPSPRDIWKKEEPFFSSVLRHSPGFDKLSLRVFGHFNFPSESPPETCCWTTINGDSDVYSESNTHEKCACLCVCLSPSVRDIWRKEEPLFSSGYVIHQASTSSATAFSGIFWKSKTNSKIFSFVTHWINMSWK